MLKLNLFDKTFTFSLSDREKSILLKNFKLPEDIDEQLVRCYLNTGYKVMILYNNISTVCCKVSPLCKIRGGKGGFGAALKAQGKTKVGETTDFGSCRDLNGNRLRSANNRKRKANLLKNLAVPKHKKIACKSNEWHIETPAWIDTRKTINKKKKKTTSCVNFTKHGHCMRGKFCTFKHDFSNKPERKTISKSDNSMKFNFTNLKAKVMSSLKDRPHSGSDNLGP